eukprot:4027588-Amphidinium_carterae.1
MRKSEATSEGFANHACQIVQSTAVGNQPKVLKLDALRRTLRVPATSQIDQSKTKCRYNPKPSTVFCPHSQCASGVLYYADEKLKGITTHPLADLFFLTDDGKTLVLVDVTGGSSGLAEQKGRRLQKWIQTVGKSKLAAIQTNLHVLHSAASRSEEDDHLSDLTHKSRD